MFIYTGSKPLRIFVQGQPGGSRAGFPTPRSRSDFDARTFYDQHNFQTYPDPYDSGWDDDYLPFFLGAHFQDSRLERCFLETRSPEVIIPPAETTAGAEPLADGTPSATGLELEAPERPEPARAVGTPAELDCVEPDPVESAPDISTGTAEPNAY